MQAGKGHEQALSLWSIQEGLLQSYRSIFITCESIVFAVAAGVSATNPISSLILSVLGFSLLWMWHVVCRNRAVDVSFAQWMVLRIEDGADVSAHLTLLKKFQGGLKIEIKDQTAQRRATFWGVWLDSNKPYLSLAKSPTRTWMETALPMAFIVLWLLIGIMAASSLVLFAA